MDMPIYSLSQLTVTASTVAPARGVRLNRDPFADFSQGSRPGIDQNWRRVRRIGRVRDLWPVAGSCRDVLGLEKEKSFNHRRPDPQERGGAPKQKTRLR